ncbi:hypothetical protein niasHS_005496 [Heterodera schachtii]|uniref:Uncharacterized protein n=1 Tax=Heterodera schachtii TaxID=97005 RepID=A0ABD2K0N8_HETSC
MLLHRWYTNHHSFHDHFKSHIYAIRKLWPYTDNILTLAVFIVSPLQHQKSPLKASLTICIGAQLKTMHNVRILTCDQLVDLLTVDRSNNTSNNINANSSTAWHCANNCDNNNNNNGISARTDNNNDNHNSSSSTICHSRRQLKKIESNSSLPRLMISTCNSDIVDDNSAFSQDLDGDHQPADVYVTNHSNLSAVQVVFHVVGDRQLVEQDISSRHPCINALRNVIRLAPHSGINHITFPLLLVQHMTDV